MSEQGPPAPLTARSLTIATLVALVIAGLALTVYILPANYGVDPIGTGSALGINGQPPADAAASRAPEPPTVALEEDPIHAYELAWPTTTDAGPEAEGYTAENETTTVELDLRPSNITQTRVTLTWTDDNETAGQQTQPDELELVLEAPNGSTSDPVRAENGPDGEGTLATALTLRPASEGRTIRAFDAPQALQHPAANVSAQAPAGPWRVHVTVVEAGDADLGVSQPEGSPEGDEGTDWQLNASTDAYERTLEDLGPADVREDEGTFELAPGEGMEHKVRLNASEPLAYAWSATNEMYTDFHGEPADGSGFTSYSSGSRETSTGTFTAPMTGTHGWYWENQGEEPVAITLVTRGHYEDGFTT